MHTHAQHDPLHDDFAALRQALHAHAAPRGVEKELLAAFANQYRRPPWYARLPQMRWQRAGGLGSCLALALVLLLALEMRPLARTGSGGAPLLDWDAHGAFIALDTLDQIAQAPAPQLMQAELPGSALAAAGLPVAPDAANTPVRAELLVAADGRPLAIRLSSNP